jgi:hypothetical protein
MRSAALKMRRMALALAALLLSACNLVAATPSPVPSPTLPATPTFAGIPSITPLPGLGQTATPAACAIPQGWQAYTVRVGDSLTTIAERSGSTVPALVQGNCLPNADQIFVGQVLYLPFLPPDVRPTSSG